MGESFSNTSSGALRFIDDHVIDVDLIEAVGLRLKELSALLDSGIYQLVAVCLERDIWIVLFEEVLIDAVIGAEKLERGLQMLHGKSLSTLVEGFVVDSFNFQNCCHVAGFSEESVVVPETVEVHLRVQ